MVFSALEMKEGLLFESLLVKPLHLILNIRFQENLETMFQLGVNHTLRCLHAFLYGVIFPVLGQLYLSFCVCLLCRCDYNKISCAT